MKTLDYLREAFDDQHKKVRKIASPLKNNKSLARECSGDLIKIEKNRSKLCIICFWRGIICDRNLENVEEILDKTDKEPTMIVNKYKMSYRQIDGFLGKVREYYNDLLKSGVDYINSIQS